MFFNLCHGHHYWYVRVFQVVHESVSHMLSCDKVSLRYWTTLKSSLTHSLPKLNSCYFEQIQ